MSIKNGCHSKRGTSAVSEFLPLYTSTLLLLRVSQNEKKFSRRRWLAVRGTARFGTGATQSDKIIDTVSRIDSCANILIVNRYLSSMWFHGMGWDGTTNFWKSSHPMGQKFFLIISHGMGREVFKRSPIPWDSWKNIYPMGRFFSSHPIPRGALVRTIHMCRKEEIFEYKRW